MFHRIVTLTVLLALLLPAGLFAADLSVPVFELATFGSMNNGSFNLTTSGILNLSIQGGYKFGGKLDLSLEGDELEAAANDQSLQFKSASVTIRELFSLPVNLSYFTGRTDTFGTGQEFPAVFGTDFFSSSYRGFIYFPSGVRYDGIHTVSGTGMQLTSDPVPDHLKLFLYLYQDSYLGPGRYSVDFRSMINFRFFKIETFAGASFPASDVGYYRGGVMIFYATETGGEFLTQIAIPRWDPENDPLNVDLFYFLFEPRVRFDVFSVILSLFWHPKYYLQKATEESGSVDINLNLLLGDKRKTPVSGGLESLVSFRTYDNDQLNFKISPHLSIVSSGVIWDIKFGAKLLPFTLQDMFEGYIGIKTEF